MLCCALQGIGHTLSGYGSYLLKPEQTEEGGSPPGDEQQMVSDKPANGQQEHGQVCKEDGQAAATAKRLAASLQGQAARGACAQTPPPPAQLRSRRQLQVPAARSLWQQDEVMQTAYGSDRRCC